MYREIVILLSSPHYFFPLLVALVSLSRRLSSDIFSARRGAIRVAASVALANELAIITSFFFLFFICCCTRRRLDGTSGDACGLVRYREI